MIDEAFDEPLEALGDLAAGDRCVFALFGAEHKGQVIESIFEHDLTILRADPVMLMPSRDGTPMIRAWTILALPRSTRVKRWAHAHPDSATAQGNR